MKACETCQKYFNNPNTGPKFNCQYCFVIIVGYVQELEGARIVNRNAITALKEKNKKLEEVKTQLMTTLGLAIESMKNDYNSYKTLNTTVPLRGVLDEVLPAMNGVIETFKAIHESYRPSKLPNRGGTDVH